MTVQQIVDMLNSAWLADPEALAKLIEQRVSCNKLIEQHPTVIPYGEQGDEQLYLGVLGLINGIAGLDGEIIEACYEDGNERLIGFRLRKKKPDGNTQA